MKLTVNGTPFTGFTFASAIVSVETMANDFSFTASAVNGFPPFKKGDLVMVTIDGVTILTGFIDEINGIDQEGSHTVTYSGRDRTSDFIDSQINTINDIRADAGLTLKQIIESILSHLNSDLRVVDNLSPAPFNKAEDIVSPEVGDSALAFALIYARKRQALLSSTSAGNILITQSSPTDSGAVVQRINNSDSNNIISQSWTIDSKLEYNKYILRGQLDPRASNFGGDTDIAAVEDQGAVVTDSSSRQGRQKVIVETKGYSSGQLADRAKWSSQIAKAQATRFNCVVKGHAAPTGEHWKENTLVQVNSDVADISRKMLLNSIIFSQQESGSGQISTLEFVEKNAYTINEKLLNQRPVGSQNDIFG